MKRTLVMLAAVALIGGCCSGKKCDKAKSCPKAAGVECAKAGQCPKAKAACDKAKAGCDKAAASCPKAASSCGSGSCGK